MSKSNRIALSCILIALTIGSLVYFFAGDSGGEIQIVETPKSPVSKDVRPDQEAIPPINPESDSAGPSVHPVTEKDATNGIVVTKLDPAVPAQLRRGLNKRLLLEEAVTVAREKDTASISPEIIFSPKNGEISGPLTIDQHTLSAIESTLDLTALAAFLESDDGAIRIPLSADLEVLATFDKVVTRGRQTTTLVGKVVDDSYSDVLLVFHDGAVSGSIAFYDTNTHYQFAMAGNGDVAIRNLDTHSFEGECGGCSNPDHIEADLAPDDVPAPGTEEPEGEILRAPAGSQPFDVVVGYSAEARQTEGGTAAIEAKIIASVDRLNTAISNSLAGSWFCSLLAMIEDPDTTFSDSNYSDMNDILIDLRQTTNGPLDTITDLQQELGADQATFVCNGVISGTAGIAGRPGVYAITARSYMTSNQLVFSHEMGHNLGLRHAWGDSGDANTSPTNVDNYGWRFRASGGSKFSTIMAYQNGWGGSRIPYFSNPDVSYNGALTGAVKGFNATDNSSSPAYDQQLVSGGAVGTLGAGYDGSNSNLGARNGPYLLNNVGTMVNKDTRAALAVLEPATNAALDPGASTTIYWHGGDHTDTVQIDLYKGGTFQSTIASGISGEDRWYDWTVPNVIFGTDYAIRVTLSGSATDDSSVFSIGNPIQRLPYEEDFEGSTGAWVQATDDDYDWTRHTGGTETPDAGPSGASSGSYYMYAEGHHNLGSNKTAAFQCTFDFSVVRETTLSFDYHMYGNYIDYLAVDVHDGTSWTNDVWIKNGQQHASSAAAWSTASVDLSAFTGNDEVTVRFRTANTRWNAADPAVDKIKIDVAPIPLPYAESFENGLAAWTQATDDDYDWTVHTGGTESPAAGPDGASDGSYYLYAEGHHGLGSNKTASVQCSFDLDTATGAELTFDYHMYGAFIEYLAVDIHNGTSWTNDVWIKNGQQHTGSSEPWSKATLDLSAYAGNSNVTVRFRTANTQYNSADPAIDNIRLFEPVGPLVAHWSMDDGSGSVVSDDAGNGFDATASDTTWTTGIVGSALEFNGSTSTVTLPAASFFTISDEITLSMWAYGGPDQPRNDSVFYAVNGEGNRVLNVHLPFSDGNVYWDAGTDGTYDRINKLATSSQFKEQWNHWAFTKNATTGVMAIYLNGELWHSATSMTRSMAGITAATLGSQTSSFGYSGTIDDVRLYNVSLDATGVSDLFTNYTTASGVPFGWLMSHGIDPSEAGALADTDTDDQSNQLEWIFGTDPLVADSPIKTLSTSNDVITSDDVMTISYTRRKVDGVNVYAVWSPDMTASNWETTGLTELVTHDDGEIETVSVTMPMDVDKKFIRIKVD